MLYESEYSRQVRCTIRRHWAYVHNSKRHFLLCSEEKQTAYIDQDRNIIKDDDYGILCNKAKPQ